MKKIIFTLILLVSCSSNDIELKKKAELAEKLFSNGKLEESYKLYQELEKSGVSNPLIYERLAESSNDNSLGIFYLRKALLLDVSCQSCAEKLENLRSNVKFSPMLKETPLLTSNFRSILIIIIAVTFSAWLLCFMMIPQRIFIIGVIPLLSAAIWILSGTYCGTDFPAEIESCLFKGIRKNAKQAIIINENTYALSSKDINAQAVLNLPKGAEIIINTTQEDWARVELPLNRFGWLKIDNLKFVD